MATMEQSNPLLTERVARLETAIKTERPHLATKEDVGLLRADMNLLRADVERQTRLLIMWSFGMGMTLLGIIIGVFLHLNEQLNLVLRSLP